MTDLTYGGAVAALVHSLAALVYRARGLQRDLAKDLAALALLVLRDLDPGEVVSANALAALGLERLLVKCDCCDFDNCGALDQAQEEWLYDRVFRAIPRLTEAVAGLSRSAEAASLAGRSTDSDWLCSTEDADAINTLFDLARERAEKPTWLSAQSDFHDPRGSLLIHPVSTYLRAPRGQETKCP